MVMGLVWALMVGGAIAAGLYHGTAQQLSAAAMAGASEALTLALSLGGALCLWSGLVKAMECSGILNRLAHWMRPVLRRLFPQTCRDEIALGHLSANVSANLLGLGNAATPLGIAAVQRMKHLSGASDATDEMCLLIVMNTASIQLLPTTVASVRASLGAASPLSILPAVWITSVCSVSAGIVSAKLFRRLSHD